jgi:thiol-disulfide isomerase/thioredoxin
MQNFVETFLLNCGFSWTSSKFIPYLLLVVLGIICGIKIKNTLLRPWLKILAIFLCISLPFGTYFYFFPIYQPDLINQSYRPQILPKIPYKAPTLIVVILPGCPYCEASIDIINQIKAQNPKLHNVYQLVSDDPESQKWFKKVLNKKIEVSYSKQAPLWMLAAEGVFPSYLLFDNKRLKAAWHNTTFGVRALDELRSYN